METITPKQVKIARTRSGVPCLWESLVAFDEISRSTIILDAEGQSKRAYYYNEEREKQALVGIKTGDHVVKCFKDAHGFAISIFEVAEISSMDNIATLIPVYRKSSLVEAESYPEQYLQMINTCMDKLQSADRKIIAHREHELENAI